jgi:hypothetical protein
MDVRTDDSDIDALLGSTIAKVGESPKVLEAAAKLQAMDDAATRERKLVDPKTLPLRFHRLKQFASSPAHYLHACQSENVEAAYAPLALRMGSGVHAGLFEDRPLICYDGHRDGKIWDRFRAKHEARRAVILNAREYSIARGIIASVRKHERAMALLFDGTTREETFDWDFLGRAARATPDAYVPGGRNTDLKSTRCAEPRKFARDAIQRHYHAQLAYYDAALLEHAGKIPDEDFIVAVENVPPFNVVVFRIPDETLEVGARLCRQWFEQLAAAEASDYYAGYVESDVDLEIPSYLQEHEPVTVEVNGELVTVD